MALARCLCLVFILFSPNSFASEWTEIVNQSEELLIDGHQTEDEIYRQRNPNFNYFAQVLEHRTYDNQQIEKAYQAFLKKGVPKIPLKQAFEFYRNNRNSQKGLRDSSCLIAPMSETGEIPADAHRFDPTTLEVLEQGIRNERYIMIVDFTKARDKRRGFLLDLEPDQNGEYSLTTMAVSHGAGSKTVKGVPQVFTNEEGHGTTVSGFHVTAIVPYEFFGSSKHYGKYRTVGLRLYGLESTNNTAEGSSKVSHGSPYTSKDWAGNSLGCPAMDKNLAEDILPRLTGGVLWYHYTKINQAAGFKAKPCH